MISEDDGATWTTPVLIAKGGSVAYPYLFEVQPGELWLTTMYGNLRVRLREKDFLDGPGE